MRLAEHIEGFETKRTTNFSTKVDEEDPNDAGLDVLQFYSFLSGKTGLDTLPLESQNTAKVGLEYLSIPVLLEETTDNSYIGAINENVKDLLMVHPTMAELPSSRSKLVLEDLWETENETKPQEYSTSI